MKSFAAILLLCVAGASATVESERARVGEGVGGRAGGLLFLQNSFFEFENSFAAFSPLSHPLLPYLFPPLHNRPNDAAPADHAARELLQFGGGLGPLAFPLLFGNGLFGNQGGNFGGGAAASSGASQGSTTSSAVVGGRRLLDRNGGGGLLPFLFYSSLLNNGGFNNNGGGGGGAAASSGASGGSVTSSAVVPGAAASGAAGGGSSTSSVAAGRKMLSV